MSSLAHGAAIVGAGAAVAAAAGVAVARFVGGFSTPAQFALGSVVFKPALSLRALIGGARAVRISLESGDIDRARVELATHMVSRPTGDLTPDEIAGAAIESVAENLSDSVVAPLCAFRAGGLGAAYAYRFINTADAMLGYHTEELEWFGKPAARLDDLANLIPARVSALFVAACAPFGGGGMRDAIACATRDSKLTASPNAGWPMSAMAGALGVCLTKRDHYALNVGGRPPLPADVTRSCRIVVAASLLTALLVDLS